MASFGVYCRREGVDAELNAKFRHLKSGPRVIYPMGNQMRLLLDAAVAGEARVFGLEALACDPLFTLFTRLAGGVVPSLDTVYRDLCRCDPQAICDLSDMMVARGIRPIGALRCQKVHIDVDTTVAPLFGEQEGALVGPNPRYPGRVCYHPILADCAEAGTCVGALLRPGDRGLGQEDASVIGGWLRGILRAVGRTKLVRVRIDSGGDCAAILGEIHDEGAHFIVKARFSADMLGAIAATTRWKTIERDAFGNPTSQVAEVDFQRGSWTEAGRRFRVVAMRTLERDSGRQIQLWSDLEYSLQAYVTNDFHATAEEIAFEYDGRAQIETAISELKSGWGIGKVPSQNFDANHALFLLKLLAYNLMRGFVAWAAPQLGVWRVPWLRRVLINIPGRMIRSGRRWSLRVGPKSCLRLE